MFINKLHKFQTSHEQLEISNCLLNDKQNFNKVLNFIKLFSKSSHIYVEFDGGYDQRSLINELRKIEVEPIVFACDSKVSNKVFYHTNTINIENVVLLAGKNGYYAEITDGSNFNWLQYLYFKLREKNPTFNARAFNPNYKIKINETSAEHIFEYNPEHVDLAELNKFIENENLD